MSIRASNKPITELIRSSARGDGTATSRLMDAIYPTIYSVSEQAVAKSSSDMPPTLVANEVALRVLSARLRESTPSRFAFFSFLASAARSVICDDMRKQLASKRRPEAGGHVAFDETMHERSNRDDRIVNELRSAMTQLMEYSPRKHEIVSLRFFGGWSVEEVAEQLGVSTSTVEKEWRFARAWLRKTIRESLG